MAWNKKSPGVCGVCGMIPPFRTRRGRLNLTSALGVLRYQKNTFWRSKSLWETTRPRRAAFQTMLPWVWEHNIWSFREGKSSRGYLAPRLPGICTLPNVANCNQERETMTPKLPCIQPHSISAELLQKREKPSNGSFLQSYEMRKLDFMWAQVFSMEHTEMTTIQHQY